MKWNGKIGTPCGSCGMDRATDHGLCFDCMQAFYEVTSKLNTLQTTTEHVRNLSCKPNWK